MAKLTLKRICLIFIFLYYSIKSIASVELQPDQINMAEFFWYLVKSDLSNVQCTLLYTCSRYQKDGHVKLVIL